MKNTIVGLLVSLMLLSGNLGAKVPVTQSQKLRLTDNWEFLRQDVGNIWELVRPMKVGQPGRITHLDKSNSSTLL